MKPAGGKIWFTAAELAALALPGLSKAKRKINERAVADGWALRVDRGGMPMARPRAGKGGGLEYHISLLPAAARAELAARGVAVVADVSAEPETGAAMRWRAFELMNAAAKAEAQRRVAIVASVDSFLSAGLTKTAVVAMVAGQAGVGASTLYGWLEMIDGVPASDRLPYLAPRRGGGGAEAEIDAGAWQHIRTNYLRPEKPTWAVCYRNLVDEYATPRGIAVPHARTLWRKLEREVDGRLIIAMREGAEAVRRSLPAQQRSVADLHALEAVNIDGHKFDVFVQWPGQAKPIRPIIVGIQDLYSRKILAWRIGETENAIQTRLVFSDLFRDWGIPKHCVLDNGRAFASKWITGGAKTRFRFKINELEPTGLLTSLGINIHWAMPYRGQSKPIERAWRDFCGSISKHHSMAGAYTGNKPDAKPENYGDRAIPFDQFCAFVARGIAAHNARADRRTEAARGQSFDDVFAESYQRSPIGRATPEKMRLALLTAEDRPCDRKTGEIVLDGNRYWSPALAGFAGKKVTIRFDPDNLHSDIHAYERGTDAYIGAIPVIERTGFFDKASAGVRARQEADLRRRMRELERDQDLLAVAALTEMMPDYADEAPPLVPGAARIVRHRGNTAAALKPVPAAPQEAAAPIIDRLTHAMERLSIVR